jgi:cytochrome c peroxidase
MKCTAWITICAATALTVGCRKGAAPVASEIPAEYLQMFQPLPDTIASPENPITPEKVELGRMLYFDTRLSADGTLSCYVCHPLHDYGTTHRDRAVGHRHQEGSRNEPTVFNAAGQFAQFWDGRAPDVEAQALGPPLNPVEMAVRDSFQLIRLIREVPAYEEMFRAAFPGEADPITFANFGRAIGAFERLLVTPSKWDRFLKGDESALSDDEKKGFRTFVEVGCVACHTGPYVGGTMFRKLGEAKPWPDSSDLGRYQVTGREEDKLVFKVPMLRNVTQTWPYFHDGSILRIEDAVRFMGEYQLGRNLTDEEVSSIVTWLRTLQGEIPTNLIEEPTLPPGLKPRVQRPPAP